jgi:hypothetical protein
MVGRARAPGAPSSERRVEPRSGASCAAASRKGAVCAHAQYTESPHHPERAPRAATGPRVISADGRLGDQFARPPASTRRMAGYTVGRRIEVMFRILKATPGPRQSTPARARRAAESLGAPYPIIGQIERAAGLAREDKTFSLCNFVVRR